MTKAVERPSVAAEPETVRLNSDLDLIGNFEGSDRAIKRVRKFIVDKQSHKSEGV